MIDENGQSLGVVSRDQALVLALAANLDLVIVNPSAEPPVAKVIDYGKFRYLKQKQESRQKSKTKGPEIKEIRLSLKIDPHDLAFKIQRAKKFLASGDKVKVTVKLIGREMAFKQRAYEIIERFQNETESQRESSTEKMGNRFFAVLTKK